MASPLDPKTRFIRRGSFGCVVEPALPNRNEKGNWYKFPGNVSKIFRNKGNYNFALNRTRKAMNIMKNKGQRMNTYKYNYTSRNLPKNIRNKNRCNLHNDQPIWVSRMPHLGLSIKDTDENYKLYRRIPFQIIVQQIYKLLQQVKALKDANYIHGDIRETNVMVDPRTGTMTIIDFDWLLPKDDFLNSYPMGFYSNPPESLIRDELMYIEDSIKLPKNIESFFMNVVGDPDRRTLAQKYIQQYSRLLMSENFEVNTLYDLKPFLLETLKVYYKRSTQTVNDFLFETFDSYGLGFTLFEFLDKVYPGRSEMELNNYLPSRISDEGNPYSQEKLKEIASIVYKLKIICIGLAHLSAQNRLTIKEAIEQFNKIPNIASFLSCKDDGCPIMG